MPRMCRLLTCLALTLLTACATGSVDAFNGVKIGQALPEYHPVYLTQQADPQAKLRLIEFWATWCGFCQESIPQLNRLQERYQAQGLDVVGLSNEAESTIRLFLAQFSIRYPIAQDWHSQLFHALKIQALPYAILVDASGKIVWRGQPAQLTEQIITTALVSK